MQIIDHEADGAGQFPQRRDQHHADVLRQVAERIGLHAAQQIGDAVQRLAGDIAESAGAGKALHELTPRITGARQGGAEVVAHALGGLDRIAERGNHPVTQLCRTHARPGLVHHHRAQFAGGHVRRFRDAIQRPRQRLSDLQQFGHLHPALPERL